MKKKKKMSEKKNENAMQFLPVQVQTELRTLGKLQSGKTQQRQRAPHTPAAPPTRYSFITSVQFKRVQKRSIVINSRRAFFMQYLHDDRFKELIEIINREKDVRVRELSHTPFCRVHSCAAGRREHLPLNLIKK